MSTGPSLGSSKYTVTLDDAPFKKGMQGVQSQTKHATLGLLQLGYAIDDIQYGFRSIVNNIPQLVMGFGGGAGLAGGVAIASVALNQLLMHAGQIQDFFMAGWLNVPAAQLEKLRMQAENAADAFDKLMKTPKDVEALEVKGFRDAITEAGSNKILKNIRERVATDAAEMSWVKESKDVKAIQDHIDALEADAKKFRDVGNLVEATFKEREIPGAKTQLAQAIDKAIEERAKMILGGTQIPGEMGAAFRATLTRFAREHMNDFGKKFFDALNKSSADYIEEGIRNGPQPPQPMGQFRMQDFNRAAAGMLLGGPLGREIMLDQGMAAAAKPPTDAEIRKGLKRDDIVRRAAKNVGVPYVKGQMRWILDSPQLMKDATDQLVKEQMDNPPKPKAGKNPLMDRIGAALDAAGVPGDPKGVAQEMRAVQAERIKQLMLEKGLTKQQAQDELLRESVRRQFGSIRGGQFLDPVQFSRQMQSGIFGNDIPRQQLAELKRAREILEQIQQRQNAGAPGMAGQAVGAAIGLLVGPA
jgi:hypothetical protein